MSLAKSLVSNLFCGAAALLVGCTSSDFTPGAGGPLPEQKSGEEDSGDEEESEDKQTDIPEPVTGAFLTCAFTASEAEVQAAVAGQGPSTLGIGCGLFRQEEGQFTLVDLTQLELNTELRCARTQPRAISAMRLPPGSPWHLSLTVSAEELACTIQLGVVADGGGSAAFRKSIPKITQFGAQERFDVAADRQAASQSSAQSGQGGAPWWNIAFVTLGERLGQDAAQPATNDDGNEVIRPALTGNADDTAVVRPKLSSGATDGSGGQTKGLPPSSGGTGTSVTPNGSGQTGQSANEKALGGGLTTASAS